MVEQIEIDQGKTQSGTRFTKPERKKRKNVSKGIKNAQNLKKIEIVLKGNKE